MLRRHLNGYYPVYFLLLLLYHNPICENKQSFLSASAPYASTSVSCCVESHECAVMLGDACKTKTQLMIWLTDSATRHTNKADLRPKPLRTMPRIPTYIPTNGGRSANTADLVKAKRRPFPFRVSTCRKVDVLVLFGPPSKRNHVVRRPMIDATSVITFLL
ncbi:hypothetical protein F4859DRAFT_460815 [Xylaria cf. heliscus]|nr:hypothetical protein F4859DRAFT_460815 [Xylaria cf. heliscus]